MAYSNILPRTSNITGANCTGSDGTADRTYTLPDVGILTSGIDIAINGASLHEGASYDFLLSSNVVTFLNIVDDTDVISIKYWITISRPSESTITTSTALRYSTPLMLTEVLGIKKNVPSWEIGSTPTNEAVGTGDSSTTEFYTDQQNVISDTYYLYANDVLMTETTHYSIDLDDGKITLTTAGVTMLSTNDLTAKYCYVENGMSNTHLITTLLRAEKEVDNSINSIFTDGTADNPDYPLKIEIQKTRGYFQDKYISEKKPVIDIDSTLDGDMTAIQTTIDVNTSDGTKFPSTGYLIIGSEIVYYSGITDDEITGVTRGHLGTTAATHTDGDEVHSTIVLLSDTSEGTSPTYTVQPWRTNVEVDEYGMIYRYKDASPDALSRTVNNRLKLIYLYGYNTIPVDITRLTLMLAKKMLVNDTISKAYISGRNEFNPETIRADDDEIKRITNSYLVLNMGIV